MGAPCDLVKTRFIEPMQGTFKKTPGSNADAYFASVSQKLAGLSEEILSAAAAELVEQATSSTWPYLGVISAACKSAQERLSASQNEECDNLATMAGNGYPWPETVAVRVLINHDASLATGAALAGWHAELIDFVRRKKRVPSMAEIEPFVVATMERDTRIAKQKQAALDVLKGEHNSQLEVLPANHPVQLLVRSVENRRNRLAVLIAETVEEVGEVIEDEF